MSVSVFPSITAFIPDILPFESLIYVLSTSFHSGLYIGLIFAFVIIFSFDVVFGLNEYKLEYIDSGAKNVNLLSLPQFVAKLSYVFPKLVNIGPISICVIDSLPQFSNIALVFFTFAVLKLSPKSNLVNLFPKFLNIASIFTTFEVLKFLPILNVVILLCPNPSNIPSIEVIFVVSNLSGISNVVIALYPVL